MPSWCITVEGICGDDACRFFRAMVGPSQLQAATRQQRPQAAVHTATRVSPIVLVPNSVYCTALVLAAPCGVPCTACLGAWPSK